MSKKWYYISPALDRVGPISSKALKALADKGMIKRDTTLISEDGERLFEAGTVQGLFEDTETFDTAMIVKTPAQTPAPTQVPVSMPTPTQKSSETTLGLAPIEPLQPTATPQYTPPAPGRDPFAPQTPVSTPSLPGTAPGAYASGVETADPLAATFPSYDTFPDLMSSPQSPFDSFPGYSAPGPDPFAQSVPTSYRPAAASSDSNSRTLMIAGICVLVGGVLCFGAVLLTKLTSRSSSSVSGEVAVAGDAGGPKAQRASSARKLIAGFSFDVNEPFPPKPPAQTIAAGSVPLDDTSPFAKEASPFVEDEISTPSSRIPRRSSPSRAPRRYIPGGVRSGEEETESTADDSAKPGKRSTSRRSDAPQPRTETLTTEQLVAEVEGSVALISGKFGSGTGFVVRDGIIATNSHVIGGEEISALEVIFPSSKGAKKGPFKPKLLYEDRERDLAFLEIAFKDHPPIPVIQDYRFRRAQDIIVIGNPGRGDGQVLENAVSKGILSTETTIDEQQYYQLNISVNPGNSGGPVLDDKGNVIGVVTLKAAKNEGTAYCIPPDEFNDALEIVDQSDAEQVKAHQEAHRNHVPLQRGLALLMAIGEAPPAAKKELAEKALKEFEEAVKCLPETAIAYFGRGLLRAALGNVEAGIADLDKAVTLAPEDKDIARARDEVKTEYANQRRVAGGQFVLFEMPRNGMGRFRSGDPRGGPRGQMTPEEEFVVGLHREARYRAILQKELWTQTNGQKIEGKLVGFEDGIAKFQPKGGGKQIARYPRLFIRQDMDDLLFYADYHGIPTETGPKRWRR